MCAVLRRLFRRRPTSRVTFTLEDHASPALRRVQRDMRRVWPARQMRPTDEGEQ